MIFIYIFLLLVSALFYILYEGAASLLILCFFVITPIIIIVSNFIASKKIKLHIATRGQQFSAGQNIPVYLTLTSNTIIPVMCAEITIEYKSSTDPSPERIKINTPIFPNNEQDLQICFSSEHYGVINCRIAKIKLYDMLRISHFKLPKGSVTENVRELIVIPEPILLENPITVYSDSLADSDSYSDSKAGDDPSEIFSIHEYADGDKLSKIHWKLTAKQDKLMVKDYSLPLANHFMILTDCCLDKASKEQRLNSFDTVIRSAFSLSFYLQQCGSRHTIAFFNNKTGSAESVTVADEEDCLEACLRIISAGIPPKSGLALRELLNNDELQPRYSHFIFIAARADEDLLSALSNCGIAKRYTVITNGSPNENVYGENFTVIGSGGDMEKVLSEIYL